MMTTIVIIFFLAVLVILLIGSIFLYRYIDLRYNQWEDLRREEHRKMIREKYPNRY